ncbi:hypothetical protein SK128_003877, partial [Halocaridina rubra]
MYISLRLLTRAWHKKFTETGTVLDKGRSRRPRNSEENIDRIRQAFNRSSTKSIRLLLPDTYSYH